MLKPKVHTVSQVNRYIRGIFEKDFILQSLWVKGEVSNYKRHSMGHLYFTIKDENSAINCVMFKGSAMIMPFELENGMEVNICGYVSTYEKTGQYQLYAEIIEPSGIGSLTLAFEQIKTRLLNEGLFDEDYKREISKNPKTIAVITSPTGAAVRDIINVSKRRNNAVEIVVVPSLVQGENAAREIAKAIKDVNEWGKADTIILGRGGGSIEDLWAFNEEIVARAIFASETPVISAVGHETDFTISDFVADLRAPTPSAAAELAVNDVFADLDKVNALRLRINFAVEKAIQGRKKHIEYFSKGISFRRVHENVVNSVINLDKLKKDIDRSIMNILSIKKQKLYYNSQKLELLYPLAVLKRGFTMTFNEENQLVSSADNIKAGDIIKIKFHDGEVLANAKGVKVDNGEEKA